MDPRGAMIIEDARLVAEEGLGRYQEFFKGLARDLQQALVDPGEHEKLKAKAEKIEA
jgi:hypothetical protein